MEVTEAELPEKSPAKIFVADGAGSGSIAGSIERTNVVALSKVFLSTEKV